MNLQEAYSILNLSPNASLDEVKQAYRKRALETHPDRGGNASDFVKVRASYEILLKYCNATPNDKQEDYDIPVPNELRNVINDIVNGFSNIYYNNEKNIHSMFNAMSFEIHTYIYSNDLQTLGYSFNNFLKNKIYTTINSIIKNNNEQTQKLMQNYEKWFSNSFNELNNEIYALAKFNYWKSPEFFVSIAVFAFIIYICYSLNNDSSGIVLGIILGIVFVIAFYLFTIKIKAESTQRIKPKDFNFDFEKVSSLSKPIENHVRGFTTAAQIAVWNGIRSNDVSTGIAGFLIGAAIKLIGEATGSSKKLKLATEADKVISEIENDFTKFYSKEMKDFLNELQANITNNYKERNKNLVLQLTQN